MFNNGDSDIHLGFCLTSKFQPWQLQRGDHIDVYNLAKHRAHGGVEKSKFANSRTTFLKSQYWKKNYGLYGHLKRR